MTISSWMIAVAIVVGIAIYVYTKIKMADIRRKRSESFYNTLDRLTEKTAKPTVEYEALGEPGKGTYRRINP